MGFRRQAKEGEKEKKEAGGGKKIVRGWASLYSGGRKGKSVKKKGGGNELDF